MGNVVNNAGTVVTYPSSSGTTVNTGGISIGTVVEGVVGGSNFFPKWSAALAKVKAGTGDAKIMFIGDSTVIGTGVTYPNSYPLQLAAMLSAAGLPVSTDYASQSTNLPAYYSLGSNWTVQAVYSSYKGVNPVGDFVFTPLGGSAYDTFDVYYLGLSTTGTVQATVTDQSAVAINTNKVTSATYKQTLTGNSATNNTVTFNTVSGGNGTVYLTAVEGRHSSTRRIRVANYGIHGSTTTSWSTTSNFYPYHTVEAYQPDLLIIMLGINDASTAVSVNTVTANLQTLITLGKVTGDVILLSPVPSNTAYVTTEGEYAAAYATLAQTNGIKFVDVFTLFGGAYHAAWMSDTQHPNATGYGQIAAAVDAVLPK